MEGRVHIQRGHESDGSNVGVDFCKVEESWFGSPSCRLPTLSHPPSIDGNFQRHI
jgi:hypothetical protein